jgi:hypothetical protein
MSTPVDPTEAQRRRQEQVRAALERHRARVRGEDVPLQRAASKPDDQLTEAELRLRRQRKESRDRRLARAKGEDVPPLRRGRKPGGQVAAASQFIDPRVGQAAEDWRAQEEQAQMWAQAQPWVPVPVPAPAVSDGYQSPVQGVGAYLPAAVVGEHSVPAYMGGLHAAHQAQEEQAQMWVQAQPWVPAPGAPPVPGGYGRGAESGYQQPRPGSQGRGGR